MTGVISYLDDVIVVAETLEQHKLNLENVLERIKKWGFKVRYEKCSFFLQEIVYLGFIVDQHGRRPDPEKTNAIAKMPEPKNTTQVRAFLGMINFYCQFIRNIREIRAPLDNLLKKSAKFIWSSSCKEAFAKAKLALQSDLLLTHFDANKPIIVAADASCYGIGGVIMHSFPDCSHKPIAQAARSLNFAEKN